MNEAKFLLGSNFHSNTFSILRDFRATIALFILWFLALCIYDNTVYLPFDDCYIPESKENKRLYKVSLKKRKLISNMISSLELSSGQTEKKGIFS